MLKILFPLLVLKKHLIGNVYVKVLFIISIGKSTSIGKSASIGTIVMVHEEAVYTIIGKVHVIQDLARHDKVILEESWIAKFLNSKELIINFNVLLVHIKIIMSLNDILDESRIAEFVNCMIIVLMLATMVKIWLMI